MSVTQDTARLVLETIGAEGLDSLKAKIAALPAELGELSAAFGRGELTAAEYNAEAQRISQTHSQLSSTVERFEKSATGATNKMAGMGQATLQTGRIIQDFAQGGIAGVLNNIEGFTRAVGLGNGAAGALTVLGVAIWALAPALQSLIGGLTGANRETELLKGTVGALEERVKELESKKIRLPVETYEIEQATKRLQELKEAVQAFEQAGKTRGYFERESGSAVAGTLAESKEGERAIRDAIYSRLVKDATANNGDIAEAKATIADATAKRDQAHKLEEAFARHGDIESATQVAHQALEQAARINTAEATIAAAQQKIQQDMRNLEGEILKGAKEGDVNRQRQLAEMLRRIGKGNLAAGIEAASPEQIQLQEEQEQELEQSIEQQKEGRQARKKANDKLVDALNRQADEGDKLAKENTRALEQEKAKEQREEAKATRDHDRREAAAEKAAHAQHAREQAQRAKEAARQARVPAFHAAPGFGGMPVGMGGIPVEMPAGMGMGFDPEAFPGAGTEPHVGRGKETVREKIDRARQERRRKLDARQRRKSLSRDHAAATAPFNPKAKILPPQAHVLGGDDIARATSPAAKRAANLAAVENARRNAAESRAANLKAANRFKGNGAQSRAANLKAFQAKQAAIAAAAMKTQETTQGVVAETQSSVMQLAARVRNLEARNRQLQQRQQGLNRAVTAGSPTNLPAGEQN